MTDDLKARIKLIIHDTEYYGHDLDDAVDAVEREFNEAASSQIYTVCALCGTRITAPTEQLVNLSFAGHEREVHGYKTGKDWYERFRREYDSLEYAPHDLLAVKAAAKAAGILESEAVTDSELLDPKNLANMSQTYRNDDPQFQAEEIHPVVEVDNKPLKFRSDVTKLSQADLGKKVFIDMSHQIPGTLAIGEVVSFGNRNKIANVLVNGAPYPIPYDRLQFIKYKKPWEKL